jgi:FtsZ-binding cell division protein ZapB
LKKVEELKEKVVLLTKLFHKLNEENSELKKENEQFRKKFPIFSGKAVDVNHSVEKILEENETLKIKQMRLRQDLKVLLEKINQISNHINAE